MKPPAWRFERDVYPFFVPIQTRFRDMDHLRHVNNMAVAGYHDEARSHLSQAYFKKAGDITGTRIVTVEQRVNFLAEVFHPNMLEAACGILKIGSSSYEIGQAVFQKGRCVGVCTAVLVSATRQHGVSPLPQNLRDALETYRIHAPRETAASAT